MVGVGQKGAVGGKNSCQPCLSEVCSDTQQALITHLQSHDGTCPVWRRVRVPLTSCPSSDTHQQEVMSHCSGWKEPSDLHWKASSWHLLGPEHIAVFRVTVNTPQTETEWRRDRRRTYFFKCVFAYMLTVLLDSMLPSVSALHFEDSHTSLHHPLSVERRTYHPETHKHNGVCRSV